MNITIYYPKTKLKATYKSGIDEYAKRLQRYCKCKSIAYNSPSQLEKKLSQDTIIIEVSPQNESISSEDLAEKLNTLAIKGQSKVAFILYGIDSELKNLESFTLIDKSKIIPMSISSMDFSTDMTLLVLYEQIYRGFRIINNHTYHK